MRIEDYNPDVYTEESVKFVNEWVLGTSWKKCTIIGTRSTKDSREEDLLFYRNSKDEVRIACLPRKHSKGKGWEGKPCFWGDLHHFCKVQHQNVYGFNKSIWYRHDSYMKIKKIVLATFGPF